MKNKLKVKNIKGKIFEYLSWYSPNVLWYIRIILNHIVTPWLQSGQVSRWFSNFLYMTYMNMPQHRNPCLEVIKFYNFDEGFHVETSSKCVNYFFILHAWLLKKKSIGFCFIYHIRWIHKMFQQISLKKKICVFPVTLPSLFFGVQNSQTLNLFLQSLAKKIKFQNLNQT